MLSGQAQMCPTSASRETSVNEQIRSLDWGLHRSSGRCHFSPVGRCRFFKRAASTAFESKPMPPQFIRSPSSMRYKFSPARRVLGNIRKNDRWQGMPDQQPKYCQSLIRCSHRHWLPDIRCLNSSYPRRLLPRTEGGSTKSQRNR
jgi:hypothetical protein